MNRRSFVTLVGTAAVAASSFDAHAQQTGSPRKVGVLIPGVLGENRQRLINEGLSSELGSEKGILLVRSAEGDDGLLRKYAAELAASADVILSFGSTSLVAARQAS